MRGIGAIALGLRCHGAGGHAGRVKLRNIRIRRLP